MGRCMYPISLVLDSLRNDVRRFHTTIEAGTQDTLGLARIGDPVSIAGAKTSEHLKATPAAPGLGLPSGASFPPLVLTAPVPPTATPPPTPPCPYLAASPP